jgi:hypothetical protein
LFRVCRTAWPSWREPDRGGGRHGHRRDCVPRRHAFVSGSETFRRNVSGAADTVQTASLIGARLGMLFEEAGASLVPGAEHLGLQAAGDTRQDGAAAGGELSGSFHGFAKNVAGAAGGCARWR